MSSSATLVKHSASGTKIEQYNDFTKLDPYCLTLRADDNAYVNAQSLFGQQYGDAVNSSAALLGLRSGSNVVKIVDDDDLSGVFRIVLWKQYDCVVQNYDVDIATVLLNFFNVQKKWTLARFLQNLNDVSVDRAAVGARALDELINTPSSRPENLNVLFQESSSLNVTFQWFKSGNSIIEKERIFTFSYVKGELL